MINIIIKVFFILSLSLSLNAYSFCFDEAGKRYNVSPTILKAIAQVESNLNPLAINKHNRNGSADYGLMQINTSWLKKLSQHNISTDDLLNNACLNVNIGAWILALNFQSHGYNWNSVGAYNAGFHKDRQKQRNTYINKVKSKINFN